MRSNYRPVAEVLESRELLAFSIAQSGNVLKLTGTKAAETVLIEDLGSNSFRVTQNEVERTYNGVNFVNVAAGKGNDTVNYDVLSPSLGVQITVLLGDGNDTFLGTIDLIPDEQPMTASSRSSTPAANTHRVRVDGGDNNDQIGLSTEGAIPAGVVVEFHAKGGSGNDLIGASFAGDNAGTLKVKLEGESGNDTLGILLGDSDLNSTNSGLIDASLDGNSGNDSIFVQLSEASFESLGGNVDNSGTILVATNGGLGNDVIDLTASEGTQGVPAVVNSGLMSFKANGSFGDDSITARFSLTFGEEQSNIDNSGTIRLVTDGDAGKDTLVNQVAVNNSDTGRFYGRSIGGLNRDRISYFAEFFGTGLGSAVVEAGPLDDSIQVTAIVQVLNARRERISVVEIV